MLKKLKAFTMAEAILVMTILGIIATIMISTLKPAEFKEQAMRTMAKKVLSEIDVATTQILMNNTADGTFDTLYEAGSSNLINTMESDFEGEICKFVNY
jgi:type II secretory pathway pseudopilin PulG